MCDDPAFDPEITTALAMTVDDVCERLNIEGGSQDLREVIAARIIDIARSGERDPVRIRNKILQEAGNGIAVL